MAKWLTCPPSLKGEWFFPACHSARLQRKDVNQFSTWWTLPGQRSSGALSSAMTPWQEMAAKPASDPRRREGSHVSHFFYCLIYTVIVPDLCLIRLTVYNKVATSIFKMQFMNTTKHSQYHNNSGLQIWSFIHRRLCEICGRAE